MTSSHDNSPLRGVSVVVKGTTTGTTTDADGKYSIALESDNGILLFSFIWLYDAGNTSCQSNHLDVSLIEDVTQLGEVVVVGYGEKRREQLTGAVGTITSDPVRDARHGSWAAGDCFLIYPGANSCIRLEKLREGIVDIEKISIIRDLASRSSDKNVKKIMQEFDIPLKTFPHNVISMT